MRIAVVEPDGAGGMAHYAFQLCSALADAGADVTLVTSRHWELADLDRNFAVARVIDLWSAVDSPVGEGRSAVFRRLWRKVRRVGRGVRFVWAWERLTRFLIRMEPDIVQFSIIAFPFQAVFLHRMRRAGITLTQICHEFERREVTSSWLRSVNESLGRSIYSAFEVMFFHGDASLARFRSVVGEPTAEVRIIPLGNQSLIANVADGGGDLRERYRVPEGRPVVLFFGGLRFSKGLPDLVDAFALVRERVEATLLIAGFPATDFAPEDLVNRARLLGVSDDVIVDARYLPLEEVGPLVRTGSLVVLPYRSATASAVLQVAYAFGRPVVVTDVGDLRASVDEGETGLVVAPGDVEALADAIACLISDPSELERMGRKASAEADERFAWSPIAREILATYEHHVSGALDEGSFVVTDREQR